MRRARSLLLTAAEATAAYLVLCLVARMFDPPTVYYDFTIRREALAPFTAYHPWLAVFTVAAFVAMHLRTG